jgi:hypothetical protein
MEINFHSGRTHAFTGSGREKLYYENERTNANENAGIQNVRNPRITIVSELEEGWTVKNCLEDF